MTQVMDVHIIQTSHLARLHEGTLAVSERQQRLAC